MELISINDLPRLKKKLKGYKIISEEEGIISFVKNSDVVTFKLEDLSSKTTQLFMPNYDNSILTIDASISAYFGKTPKFKTNHILDQILKTNKYKHIAIMLLDGMGSYIINENLEKDAFINTHKVCDINAVFPPTTACAVPALCSGLEPIKTGWVGWSNYFSEVDKYVVMFKNVEYYSGKSLDINVEKDILPYKKFYEDFDAYTFELGPSFTPSNCQTFEEMCDRYITEIKNKEKSFCYMYWTEPDSLMHIHGVYSKEAKNELSKIDRTLLKMSENISDDTIVIITADHGQIDVKPIYLANFIDLLSLLDRMPSNEGRCAFFKVKHNKKKCFEKLFNLYFGNYFCLLSKDEFIEEGYLGESVESKNPKLDSFIGDYVAIAKKNYYFNFDPIVSSEEKDEMVFKGHHAGITVDEMVIPLIIMKK